MVEGRAGRPALHQQAWNDRSNNHAVAPLMVLTID
jgi:hypothetical protein